MKYKGFLIDLDGTAYLGDEKIPTASEFVNKLVAKDVPFLFVSNNSSKLPSQVADKLIAHGYNISQDNIYTSAQATKQYIENNYSNKTYYIIGDEGLKKEIASTNLTYKDDIREKVDIVIVGYDNKLNYDILAKACLFIRNGAKLISTNPDISLPTQDGLMPGNGAIVSFIQTATNCEVLTIGKPSNIIMDYAIATLGVSKDKIAMIGDNYDTDIMSGINTNIDTIYVQTGLSTLEEVKQKAIKPTVILKDLSQFEI